MGQKFIKVDNDFANKSRYKGGLLCPLSREAKFKQDAKPRSKHSGEASPLCLLRGFASHMEWVV